MKKKVLVAVADGVEEVEAISIIDVLRRIGADVVVASVGNLQITTSNGVKLVADQKIATCLADTFDLIALPGGMPGAEHLRDSRDLTKLLQRQKQDGKWYAAICASPAVVLHAHGLLDGVKATCYPSMLNDLGDRAIENAAQHKVVVDKNCITSQGPGTALLFAIKLAEVLFGHAKARQLAGWMLVSLE